MTMPSAYTHRLNLDDPLNELIERLIKSSYDCEFKKLWYCPLLTLESLYLFNPEPNIPHPFLLRVKYKEIKTVVVYNLSSERGDNTTSDLTYLGDNFLTDTYYMSEKDKWFPNPELYKKLLEYTGVEEMIPPQGSLIDKKLKGPSSDKEILTHISDHQHTPPGEYRTYFLEEIPTDLQIFQYSLIAPWVGTSANGNLKIPSGFTWSIPILGDTFNPLLLEEFYRKTLLEKLYRGTMKTGESPRSRFIILEEILGWFKVHATDNFDRSEDLRNRFGYRKTQLAYFSLVADFVELIYEAAIKSFNKTGPSYQLVNSIDKEVFSNVIALFCEEVAFQGVTEEEHKYFIDRMIKILNKIY